MLRRSRFFLIGLLLFGTFNAPAKTGSELLAKQEEILLQLASEGVQEADHVLGRFYEFNAAKSPRFLSKARVYYLKSAQQGHSKSLYWLGHSLLRQPSPELRLEGLVSVCESAILGERRAQVDLVMIPRFYGDLSTQDVKQQCTVARDRLTAGKLVDCRLISCTNEAFPAPPAACPDCAEKAARFKLVWQAAGKPDYDRFFRNQIQTFSLITPDQINRYRQAISLDNRRIDLLNQLKAAKHTTEAQQAQQEIKQQLVKEDLETDLPQLKPKIQALLDKINQHRAPRSRISMEHVIEQLKKQLTPQQ